MNDFLRREDEIRLLHKYVRLYVAKFGRTSLEEIEKVCKEFLKVENRLIAAGWTKADLTDIIEGRKDASR